MPAIIDSSPSCVTNNEGMEPADDSADFILQANYEDCAGFMTFGPGSTYGDNGSSNRQIEFPEKQTHVKSFELAVLAISILCAIIVLVILLFTNMGNEFRPTV